MSYTPSPDMKRVLVNMKKRHADEKAVAKGRGGKSGYYTVVSQSVSPSGVRNRTVTHAACKKVRGTG